MNNECDIVKDLLFSYDEGSLSNTSKEFVENHLKNCDNCKNILDELNKQNNTNYNLNEIDFLKKIRKKINKRNILLAITSIFLIIIIIFYLIYLASYMKKMSIIDELKNKMAGYNNLINYSYTLTVTNLYDNNKSINEYFIKDNAFYSVEKSYSDDGKELNEYAYCEGANDIVYVDTDGQKSVSINKKEYATIGGIVPFKLTYLGESVFSYDIEKIEEFNENGKDYYIITTKTSNNKYFIEKDTGITVKVINESYIIELSYEIGNVSDDDLVKINNNMSIKEWLNSNID